jgi:drug/metabolite transporter (DMT)-like permease
MRPAVAGFADVGELALLGLLWGVTFPVARVAIDAGANPFLLVALDLLLAAAVLAPVAWLRGGPRPPARSLLQSAGLGALLIAGINLPLNWGLQYATGGTASIVYATSPLVSLAALALLGAPVALPRRQAAALGLGLFGVILLGIGSMGGSLFVALAAFAAFGIGAACQGIGSVLEGRARPQGEGTWGLTFQFLGGAVAASAVVPFLGSKVAFPVNLATVGSVAYLGILSMAVGYSIYFRLIHRAGAVRANQVTFLSPLVALTVGVLAFGERFAPIEAVALCLVVLALGLLQPIARGPAGTRRPTPYAPGVAPDPTP